MKGTDSAMIEEIIGMEDMNAIYEITDRFGIDRETISVPLEKMGAGTIEKRSGEGVEITVPLTIPTREWLPILERELEHLGYEANESEEDWE